MGGRAYQGSFEEPLLAPDPPPTGTAVAESVVDVVGVEAAAVVCEAPFEHRPRNHDRIPARPFGSWGQAASHTPVVVV